jgi:hypothetical protein
MSRYGSEWWCSMPARFDDVIPFSGNDVIAIGPLHRTEKVKEVCAWVYQPTADQGIDAAATEMHFGDDHPHPDNEEPPTHFDQVDGKRWLLPLNRIGETPFLRGQAFAVAVALVLDLNAPEKRRVVWWGQPVELIEDADLVAKAKLAGALKGVLANPIELSTTA